MQIREPLSSDWDGYIKDIYVNYVFRNVQNVRPVILADLEWVEKNKIDRDKFAGFHGNPRQTVVIVNRGLPTERRTSFSELIGKLPCDEEGDNKVFALKYDNAYFEYKDNVIKIKGIGLINTLQIG